MRKAQIIGQVFVLIIAAILFILILTYGYTAIRGISQRSAEVAFVDFVTTLKSEVKAISLSYGSVKKLGLSGLPAKYKTICFVTGKDKGLPAGQPGDLDGLSKKYPLVYELYEPGGDANVFFIPSAPSPTLLPNIDASDVPGEVGTVKWFCTSIEGGSVVLRLEGLGNGVRISEWPQGQ